MSDLEKLVKTTEARVPTAPESHRRTTDEFLEHFERRLSAALDASRQLLLTGHSDSLRGQQAYWRHSIKAIRWLRAMNRQRRSNG